ncbi:DNA-binding protein [Candidatus Rhabdochlamydia porcellionis]|jgi:DNA-binding phage protein|uniref:HEPN domain-containing protein n=1 Tax=Candidatus Rhabdochlamydia porcellionis TaxID=225148 RepID=A0ABX8Z4I6_9BACT|nr:hypothetical protein [Candidatus Rhabdochlamydia porcellionis]QZA59006.1 hypothetical protein RHAB15C_0000890 [Candidatus Rhabdochlamydia porcellionis]
MIKNKNYHEWLLKKLKDYDEAVAYLNAALEESLYKTLSENGNPKWHTLVSLVIALGLNLRLT